MSWHQVRVVLGKELLEVIRDRRTLFLMLVLPMLLYPLLLLLAANVAEHQIKRVTEVELAVGITVTDGMDPLVQQIAKADALLLVPLERHRAEDALRAGQVDLVVALPDDLETSLQTESPVTVRLLIDETDDAATAGLSRVEQILSDWKDDVIAQRLKKRDLKFELIQPFEFHRENIATPQKMGGYLLGKAVPLLVILMIVLGAFYPAVEVTAGEKERGTLQTLLTAPLRPLEIVTGKFLSVFVVAAVSAGANILSIVLVVLMGSMMPDEASRMLDLQQPWSSLLLLAGLAIVAGLMFSAIMMAVAVLARSTREAQTYLTPVYLLCVLPVVITQVPGMVLEGSLLLLPVVNLALLMRDVLEGPVPAQHVFVVVVSTLFYTGGALVAAASIFRREAIVLGDAGMAGLFSRSPVTTVRQKPRPGEAFAIITIAFLFYLYGGSLLQRSLGVAGLAISQWCFLLLPLVLLLLWKKLPLAATLAWKRPSFRHLAGAIFLGSSLWYLLMVLARLVMSGEADGPDTAAEVFLLSMIRETPIWALLLVVALTPAICEELLFRGMFLSSLRGRIRPLTAALLCGMLFGAFHLSAVGFVPKTILGMVLCWLVMQSGSVFPAIVFHALHNGFSVLLVRLQWSIPGVADDQSPVLWHLAAFMCAAIVGILLLRRSAEAENIP